MAQSFHNMTLRLWYGLLLGFTLFGYHGFPAHVDVYAMILSAWVLFAFFAIYPQRKDFFAHRKPSGTAQRVLKTLDIKEFSTQKLDVIFSFLKLSLGLVFAIAAFVAWCVWVPTSDSDRMRELYFETVSYDFSFYLLLSELEVFFMHIAPFVIAALAGMMGVFFASCSHKTMIVVTSLWALICIHLAMLLFHIQPEASIHALSFLSWILAAYICAKQSERQKSYYLYLK